MRPYIFIGLLILALIAVVFFIQNIGSQCSTNADCVPATCYHASQCVPKLSAPNCTGILGTQECVPNTLDCGQGSCACEKGICKANISK
jgi:hypothetical protein